MPMAVSPWSIAALVFVGCMFIGRGIGAVKGKKSEGTIIGMGVGFVLMAVCVLLLG